MTRDELITLYGERRANAGSWDDERTMEVYGEIGKQLADASMKVNDLLDWASGKHLTVDKDSWKLYHTFLDELQRLATYSLLVSNVGWVRRLEPDYDEVLALFNDYKSSGQYDQVTMWSSEEHDPIEEYYSPNDPDSYSLDDEEGEGQ